VPAQALPRGDGRESGDAASRRGGLLRLGGAQVRAGGIPFGAAAGQANGTLSIYLTVYLYLYLY